MAEEIDKLYAVYDAMMLAGWIKSYARDGEGVLVAWTRNGIDNCKQFASILEQAGVKLDRDYIAAIRVAIDSGVEPGDPFPQ